VVGKVARWAVLGARTTLHLGDSPLSEREREVAELAVRGFTNQQIADRLFISPETVKTHIRNISRKLGVNNKKELRAWLRGELRTPPSGS
jgi:DNA-binding CsgD family transcriptional regulator